MDVDKYKRQFNDLEEEMATTIESYKAIIDQIKEGDASETGSLRSEVMRMQNEL